MKDQDQIKAIRDGLRLFNRRAGVLKADPYGIGLSLSQSSAIIDIERFGSLRPNDLVTLLHLEKSSISRLISVLHDKKLIEVYDDDHDGRSKKLTLTKSGKGVAKIINDISDNSVEEAFESLSPKDRLGVVRAFEKLSQAINKIETSKASVSLGKNL